MSTVVATASPPVTPPRGLDVPVEFPAGSLAGAEQYDVGTPAAIIEDQDKNVKELEKNVILLAAMIKEFLKGEDPWQQGKVGSSTTRSTS